MVSNVKVDDIERKLADNMWLGGQEPSKEDREAFTGLNGCPDADSHPNAAAWYSLVSKFSADVRESWAAGAGGAGKQGEKPKGGKKGGEPKAAAPKKGKD